jgi:TonB family protein
MIANYFSGIFESVFITSLFCLLYLMFFNKEASFKQNRFFLLFGIVLGFFVPFLDFSAPKNADIQWFVKLATIDVSANSQPESMVPGSFSFLNVLYVLYAFGVTFFLIRFLFQLKTILGFFKGADIQKRNDFKMVFTGKRHSVFSFLGFIFIDKESQHTKDLEVIINHERVHVAQMHSIDLFLFEVLAIVQWFNPFIWWYGKTIKQNHEFLADKGLLNKGFSMEKYQEVLLQNYSIFGLGLANSFNHSLTFKRLIMMKRNSSNRKSIVKLIVLLPILLVSVYFVSCSKEEEKTLENIKEEVAIEEKQVENVPKEDLKIVAEEEKTEEEVFLIVEEMPKFGKDEKDLRNFIANNVEYPEEAKKNGEEGKVYVMFVVTSEGAVDKVKIARGASPSLNEEAIRVVKSIPPTWIPGKQKGKAVAVQYTIPINFKLQ